MSGHVFSYLSALQGEWTTVMWLLVVASCFRDVCSGSQHFVDSVCVWSFRLVSWPSYHAHSDKSVFFFKKQLLESWRPDIAGVSWALTICVMTPEHFVTLVDNWLCWRSSLGNSRCCPVWKTQLKQVSVSCSSPLVLKSCGQISWISAFLPVPA